MTELTAERAVVAALDATCNTPLGVHASVDGELLSIEGFVGLPDGSEWLRERVVGDSGDPAALGSELARQMVAAGATEILERAETWAAHEGGGQTGGSR